MRPESTGTSGLLSDLDICQGPDGVLAEDDKYDFSKVSRALLFAMCGETSTSEPIIAAAEWFIQLLRSRCKAAWNPIIGPLLETTNSVAVGPSDRNLCTMFRMLRTIVLTTKNREEVALCDLVQAVDDEETLPFIDDDRWHATLMVFVALGWLSMLYTPDLCSENKSLQITRPASSVSLEFGKSRIRYRRHKSKTIRKTKQDLRHVDHPLPTLLNDFGSIIPKSKQSPISGHGSPFLNHPRQEDWICPQNVCFYNLHHLMKIQIEWVDCLSLHLEFDSQSKVLKLFRFPSICLLMCYSENTYLSRLFSDFEVSKGMGIPGKNYAREYFKEVMLSFRVVFGEVRWSHGVYKKCKSSWPNSSESESDPLLDILCGQRWDEDEPLEIWHDIDAGTPLNRYSTVDTFNFLGERFMILQNAVDGHGPDSIWQVWYDKRDTLRWWAFWAVLIIGIGSLILGVFQSILQIFQLYFTIWPSNK
ncbi:hypothetical protein BKA61DRAFT_285930 [Leptodontidium sp. MPI-SDFR-AT-0119]|nr:hypothetical protein BKA61DRAFT_285930 [Leptodontidium sp. MPI-SDFR-AT-0119]